MVKVRLQKKRSQVNYTQKHRKRKIVLELNSTQDHTSHDCLAKYESSLRLKHYPEWLPIQEKYTEATKS